MIEPSLALERLVAVPRLLVGLDYDGVLSEIVADPDAAVPVAGVAEVVAELTELPGVRVASVSGRRRKDLAERMDWPPEVILVGEHGADAGNEDLAPPEEYARVRSLLGRVVERFEGAWVEEKRSGLTVHGRALSPGDAERLAQETEDVLAGVVPGRFERGNRVVDVRLTGATKGDALLALRQAGESVLFLGDDTTDETVFRSLGDGDLGVKVGPGDTAASCRLADPHAVVEFLRALVDARREG